MDFNKEVFKEKFKNRLDEKYALDVKDATPQELYLTLSLIVRSSYSRYWRKTWKKYMEDGKKQIYYFSIEFLPGRLLMSNLLNMGWLETVRDALKDLDIDLDEIAEVEKDMALGNGGLGRLASAFILTVFQEMVMVSVIVMDYSSKNLLMVIKLNYLMNGLIVVILGKFVVKVNL